MDLRGRFVYTNPAYSAITGYTVDELKRLNIKRLMYAEDVKLNAAYRQKMLDGEIPGYVLEKRYIRKDGSLIWVKSSVSLSVSSDGRPIHIVGLTEDIDEQHRAEEALKESEARFRFMTECMPQKVFTAFTNGSIDYLSPQWLVYTGLGVKEMDLSGWSKIVHPDDLEDNLQP